MEAEQAQVVGVVGQFVALQPIETWQRLRQREGVDTLRYLCPEVRQLVGGAAAGEASLVERHEKVNVLLRGMKVVFQLRLLFGRLDDRTAAVVRQAWVRAVRGDAVHTVDLGYVRGLTRSDAVVVIVHGVVPVVVEVVAAGIKGVARREGR